MMLQQETENAVNKARPKPRERTRGALCCSTREIAARGIAQHRAGSQGCTAIQQIAALCCDKAKSVVGQGVPGFNIRSTARSTQRATDSSLWRGLVWWGWWRDVFFYLATPMTQNSPKNANLDRYAPISRTKIACKRTFPELYPSIFDQKSTLFDQKSMDIART